LTITSSCDKIISTKQRKQQSAKALQTHIVAIKSFCWQSHKHVIQFNMN